MATMLSRRKWVKYWKHYNMVTQCSEYIPCKMQPIYANHVYNSWNILSLLWRHNGDECVSNHQPHDCLFNRLFGRWSKETPKLRVTGLCAGNSLETGEFDAQMASNAENVSIWWCHHVHFVFLFFNLGCIRLCIIIQSAQYIGFYFYTKRENVSYL